MHFHAGVLQANVTLAYAFAGLPLKIKKIMYVPTLDAVFLFHMQDSIALGTGDSRNESKEWPVDALRSIRLGEAICRCSA